MHSQDILGRIETKPGELEIILAYNQGESKLIGKPELVLL
jgi:hypothetical protein